MNYAEQCRAFAAEHRENAQFWTEHSNGTHKAEQYAKRSNDVAALLDAAAGLWEAGDGIRDQMAEAMAAADAAAHELEESLYAAMAPRSGVEGEQP